MNLIHILDVFLCINCLGNPREELSAELYVATQVQTKQCLAFMEVAYEHMNSWLEQACEI